jgi:hypothetical protein
MVVETETHGEHGFACVFIVHWSAICLSHPPNLANSTAGQIAKAHRLFAEQTNTFNACNQIECTIIQQINTTLDDNCLADLINEDTGLIQGTVPEMFINLHRTFRAITPQILATAKATLEATIHNHTKPLANVFTAIARCADMASAAECEETTPQFGDTS